MRPNHAKIVHWYICSILPVQVIRVAAHFRQAYRRTYAAPFRPAAPGKIPMLCYPQCLRLDGVLGCQYFELVEINAEAA